jgi:hypothetical protein
VKSLNINSLSVQITGMLTFGQIVILENSLQTRSYSEPILLLITFTCEIGSILLIGCKI